MIQKDAVSLEDFKRMELGLPPKPKVIRQEPEKPVVADEITFEQVPETEIFEFSARRRVVKNSEGTRFSGYTIYLETREGKVVEGWLNEGEFEKLRQRIRIERPDLLSKIGL